MGCNAWNHPPSCNCGWGGDTGGRASGPGIHNFQQSWTLDGLYRSSISPTRFDSYVNPNARCPVCGASVFFYQSGAGGRVYFDELGPPWPKHTCTDTGGIGRTGNSIKSMVSLGTYLNATRAKSTRLDPNKWSPLQATKIESCDPFDLFHIDSASTGIPGRFLPLPARTYRHTPVYWRRHASDVSLIEVSTISIVPGKIGAEVRKLVPSWTSDYRDIVAFEKEEPLSAQALNRIGWSLSLLWRDKDNPQWHQLDCVDWDLARQYFERSASLGYWAARNNLGVMYSEGLGVEPDYSLAFTYFDLAAQEEFPEPLRHLATCYRNGRGVEVDTDWAQFLMEYVELEEAASR